MHRRLVPTLAALSVAVAALTGCSAGSGQSDQSGVSGAAAESSATSQTSGTSETADAAHNDQDIAFAQMMIPHHQQAIEMSDTLLAKDGVNEDVAQLATDIKAAQAPEIQTMQGWLDQWGAHSMGAMSGDGAMMSQEDMDALSAASGEDASALYLEQMIQHHLSAIDMAYEEINDGMNSDAVALAHSIVDSQSDQISTMQGMLASM